MFRGPAIDDQSDGSPWARSVEARLQKVLVRIGSAELVDRAVTAAKIALGSISASHLVAAIPRGVLGKTRVTANSAGITTVETDILTVSNCVVGASRYVKVSINALIQITAGGPGTALGQIYRGAAVIGRYTTQTIPDGSYQQVSGWVLDELPAAGTYTYKATLYRALGGGTVTVIAGAGYQTELIVEDVGGV